MGDLNRALARAHGQRARRRSSILIATITAALVALAVAATSASAATVLEEHFDASDALPTDWSITDVEGGGPTANVNFWNIIKDPQTFAVTDAYKRLVTLPDSGQLPSPHTAANAAWFGEKQTGTFCGQDADPASQPDKNGCDSQDTFGGNLDTKTIDLSAATAQQGATLHFWSWLEIEAVDSDAFDLMKVFYSTDNGTTWNTSPVQLNPASNPSGAHDQSYG